MTTQKNIFYVLCVVVYCITNVHIVIVLSVNLLQAKVLTWADG